jgi:hypothetical protein
MLSKEDCRIYLFDCKAKPFFIYNDKKVTVAFSKNVGTRKCCEQFEFCNELQLISCLVIFSEWTHKKIDWSWMYVNDPFSLIKPCYLPNLGAFCFHFEPILQRDTKSWDAVQNALFTVKENALLLCDRAVPEEPPLDKGVLRHAFTTRL